MDPLSNPIVEALKLRPVQPVNSNLLVLLRDGLVVAGEVLDVADGTAFLSLGGRRVAAEANVELAPQQRFLARVEHEGDTIVLRLLQGALDDEMPLVKALRTALGDHAPAGTLLTRLAVELRAALASREAAELASPRDTASARPATPARTTAAVRELLAQLAVQLTALPADGGSLASLLARSGLFHEALLLRGKPEAALASDDLKSQLLRALDEMPPGPERESVRRALNGIEAEQLLDVARSQSGDARQVSFALPDGAAFADAQLVVDPEAQPEQAGQERPAAQGVDVTVDFSNLGPVKAELRLEDGALRVRFLVASPAVASRLEADQSELAARLSSDGREARLAVALADFGSFELGARPADVRFLADHLLLDMTA